VGGQCHALAALPPGKETDTHGTGGTVEYAAVSKIRNVTEGQQRIYNMIPQDSGNGLSHLGLFT
jgi:hypothetical protein